MSKKIEAIIICKGYSNYLEITLPLNKKYFDNIIIVTDEFDIRTQEVCKNNKVEFIIYDGFNKYGAKFNFGGARQFGLEHIKFNSWVVFLDSDIIIKEYFIDKLIDINKFYGSYRRFIPKVKDYEELLSNKKDKTNFESIEGSGCGFFQCFNINNYWAKNHIFHEHNLYKDSYSAEQVDIEFLRLFCPLIDKDINLVRMSIELWHLGGSDGQNHEGMTGEDKFFNNK